MKFYLDNTEHIFLYQLLKAAGLFEEYAHIRRVVNDGQIQVNERTVFKQRTKIYAGDTVRFKDEHIKVLAGKEQRQKQRQESREQNIVHGKTAKWQAKPLKKEKNLQQDLDDIVKKLHNLLLQKKLSLAISESCTGGMAGQYITSQAGSSEYFLGSVVSYSNRAKQKLLKISGSLLEKDGAVSEAVARAMVMGTENIFNSDLTGAITGIAGPGGGTPDKPVGTVFIAVKKIKEVSIKEYHFKGNREEIRRKSCLKLFQMLRELTIDTK